MYWELIYIADNVQLLLFGEIHELYILAGQINIPDFFKLKNLQFTHG